MNRMAAAPSFVIENPLWKIALRRLFLPRTLNRVAEGRPRRILEIGCAAGGTTRILLDRFPEAEVVAVDADPVRVAAARDRIRDARASFLVADAAKLPFPDSSFDAAIELNTFHHVAAWREAVSECARVIAPGGAFAAMDENVRTWGPLFRLLDRPASSFSKKDFISAAGATGLTLEADLGTELFMRFVFSKPTPLPHFHAA